MRLRESAKLHWTPCPQNGPSPSGILVSLPATRKARGADGHEKTPRAVVKTCWRDVALQPRGPATRETAGWVPTPTRLRRTRGSDAHPRSHSGSLSLVRRKCPAGSITRNKRLAMPRPVRLPFVSTLAEALLGASPLRSVRARRRSRPKMERKWKCKPGEANAVSQVPVCRSPTPSSLPWTQGCLHWPHLDPSRQSPVPLWASQHSIPFANLNCAS